MEARVFGVPSFGVVQERWITRMTMKWMTMVHHMIRHCRHGSLDVVIRLPVPVPWKHNHCPHPKLSCYGIYHLVVLYRMIRVTMVAIVIIQVAAIILLPQCNAVIQWRYKNWDNKRRICWYQQRIG